MRYYTTEMNKIFFATNEGYALHSRNCQVVREETVSSYTHNTKIGCSRSL